MAVVALPVLASCSSGGGVPIASVASVPTSVSTPTAAPSAAPAIGDTCPVGTWRAVKGTLVISFGTPHGIVSVTVTGGSGEMNHYFSGGALIDNAVGAPLVGSGHGYRLVIRQSGTLRATAVFANGRETVEPIDSSAARLTVSVNGGSPRTLPEATYASLAYTCSGNSLTERDSIGVYTYRRVSSTP